MHARCIVGNYPYFIDVNLSVVVGHWCVFGVMNIILDSWLIYVRICNICVVCYYNCYIITVCRILSVLIFTESKSEVQRSSYGKKRIILHFCSGDGHNLCDGHPVTASNKMTVISFVTVHLSRPGWFCSNIVFIITWISWLQLRHNLKCWKASR